MSLANARRGSMTVIPREVPTSLPLETAESARRRSVAELSATHTVASLQKCHAIKIQRGAIASKTRSSHSRTESSILSVPSMTRQRSDSDQSHASMESFDHNRKGCLRRRRVESSNLPSDWTRVYFVLKRDFLRCYAYERFYKMHAPPQGKWRLTKGWVTKKGGPRGEDFLPAVGYPFFLKDSDHEGANVFMFAADSGALRSQWIQSFESAIENASWGNIGVIGAPTNFKHNVHLHNPTVHAATNGGSIPSEWIDLLRIEGMDPSDYWADPEGLGEVLDFASKELEYYAPLQQDVVSELQSIIDSKCRLDDPYAAFSDMKLVGEGSYSQVYVAKRRPDDRKVAVKIINRTSQTKKGRVLNEIAMMHVLKEHPNVVEVIDTFFKDTSVWMSMEYMDGGSLGELVDVVGRLKEDQIAYVALECLKALSFLHKRFRMHRDLKGDNILLKTDGQVKLGDFGFCAQLTEEVAGRNSHLGTPAWMAPEVIQQCRYDQRADMWSFGIVCLEMANGKVPNCNLSRLKCLHNIVSNPPPTLSATGCWSPAFQDFVSKVLVKDPELRATADEMLYHPFLRCAAARSNWARLVIKANLIKSKTK